MGQTKQQAASANMKKLGFPLLFFRTGDVGS
jgi:hypothetical protein